MMALALMGALVMALEEPLPDLGVTLGEQNSGTGLTVPSGGDGTNSPEIIAGQPARRMTGARTHYLYVCINHPAYATGPRDLYVIAEVFDEGIGRLGLQYDKGGAALSEHSLYAPAANTVFLVGDKRWRECVFFLPAARLGHGQNHRADFRLCGSGLAVRRITVTPRRPASFNPDETVDAASLHALRVERPAGMELTFGNDATATDATIFRALSVTSVESYVDWAGVEPEEGKWDWSKWDKQVATLKAAGLKWVPFLIAGPAYATPLWFQNGPASRFYRCLEHGRDSKVQTIFNPDLPRYVERFINAFAERYRDSGVIESVLLGITGIYGESIYPAGPEGGWTTRLNDRYHNHAGWWAGDELAVAAFRAAMKRRYGNVAALNKAWGAGQASFSDVTTFQPDKAPNDRARADLVEWYQQAMTDWSVLWVRATRRAMPKAEIYLCTGGNGDPVLGADFTAQAKAIAPFGAGVRITNEASDYAANFSITREVATATRHYRTFCGFEPAGGVNATGVVARIYNATASGARQLHYYTNNVLDNDPAVRNFRANAARLIPRRPRVEAALYVPRETWALAPDSIHRWYGIARKLRDIADVDFVTRLSVADGALRGCRVLVMAETPVLEPKAAAVIARWVERGGVLIAAPRAGGAIGGRLHNHEAWRARLLSEESDSAGLLVRRLDGEAPPHWTLKVGAAGDDVWLFGDWHGRERGSAWRDVPDATMRWSVARPGVYLPVKPGADHTLRMAVCVVDRSLSGGGHEVRVNGRAIGKLDKPGLQVFEARVPADVIGQEPVARLEIAARTWKPSDHGAGDTRSLGVAVRQVEVLRAGAENAVAGQATMRLAIEKERLKTFTRRVGKGWTVSLPGLADDTGLLMGALAELFRETPRFLEGVASLAPGDGQLDGRFVTTTDKGALWYDAATGTIR